MKLTVAGLTFDLSKRPESLAITLQFDGEQPNHFGADLAQAVPMRAGDFIGDTRQGGSCNAPEVRINPHCNGTHTESISHVVDELLAPHQVIKQPLVLAQVITIKPQPAAQNQDSYQPPLSATDLLISKEILTGALESLHEDVNAIIIRTLPNPKEKQYWAYGAQIDPPFFSNEAMKWLSDQRQIHHLLVDMPSVDRLNDDGLLSNHRLFWHIDQDSHELKETQAKHRTITEMVFVPDSVPDCVCLLNLQVAKWQLNAAPSNPVVYLPE